MESRLNPSLTDAEPERDWQAIALRYAEGCFAGEPCVKGQRDRRDQETFELQSFFGASLMSLRSLLSLISSRRLALKGRQITDGGKQRVAPGHGKLITPLPCAVGAREGVKGGCGTGPGVTLRSPPSVLCHPVGAKSTSVYGSGPLTSGNASAWGMWRLSVVYRSLVYLGREPVTYRFLSIRCR